MSYRIITFIETEGRMVAARGLGGRGMQNCFVMCVMDQFFTTALNCF